MEKKRYWERHPNLTNFLNNATSGVVSGLIVGIIIILLTVLWLPNYVASITPKPPILPSIQITQVDNGHETSFYISNNGNEPIPYLSVKISEPNLTGVKIDNRSSIGFRTFNGVLYNSVSIEAQNILPYDIGIVDIYSWSNSSAGLSNVSTDAPSVIFFLSNEHTGLPTGCKELICNSGYCGSNNVTWLSQNLTGWKNAINCPPNPNYSGIYIMTNSTSRPTINAH